eukprot:scaffold682_cov113-Skeletonema_menzelii.AAC.1
MYGFYSAGRDVGHRLTATGATIDVRSSRYCNKKVRAGKRTAHKNGSLRSLSSSPARVAAG